MKANHYLAVLGLLLPTGLALTISCLLIAARTGLLTPRPVGPAPVYAVGQLRADLARDAGAWVARTIRVEGVLTDCAPPNAAPVNCLVPGPADPPGQSTVDPLPVSWARPDPPLAWLRRLPLLGSLLPVAQSLRQGEPAIYRVRLRRQTQEYCGASTCYEALLLDAAP